MSGGHAIPRTGRVLIPILDQIRQEVAAKGYELAEQFLSACLNPEEPFRYEPSELPPLNPQPPRQGYSRTHSKSVRTSYRRWGRK